MNKKIIALLASLMLIGCGNNTSSSVTTSSEEHQGPSSYFDPQAVDLTKDNLEDYNFDSSFYNPDTWVGMDNDHYNAPTKEADGSLRFNNTNAAIDLGDYSNKTISFMVKGNNDWNIWLRSSNKSNDSSSNIKVECQYSVLRIKTSFSGYSAVAYVPAGYNYLMDEYNRLDFKFEVNKSDVIMKMWLNYVPVKLKVATDFSKKGVKVKDGNLYLEQSDSYRLGNFFIVKIWDDEDYLHIKSVSQE